MTITTIVLPVGDATIVQHMRNKRRYKMSKKRTSVDLFGTKEEEIVVGEKRIVKECPPGIEIRRGKMAFCLEFEEDKVGFIVFEQKENGDYGKTIFEAEFSPDDVNAAVEIPKIYNIVRLKGNK